LRRRSAPPSTAWQLAEKLHQGMVLNEAKHLFCAVLKKRIFAASGIPIAQWFSQPVELI
jgi:hypothetical protein